MQFRHFALTRYPFEPAIEADSLFESEALRQAEIRLRHLVDRRGAGLLTGEPGCGKTSLLRRVCSGLHPGRHKVVYVALTTGTVLDCCNLIGAGLGCEPAVTRFQAWSAIREQVGVLVRESRQLPVLVVDEAHLLRTEVIEELRLTANHEMDSESRLCLLLCGTATLRRRLGMTVFESLAQRLAVQHHMGGLGRGEIQPCVENRLRLAGAPDGVPLFSPAAWEALHLASSGIPRLVNRVAHYALLAAFADKVRMADPEHVNRAAIENGLQVPDR